MRAPAVVGSAARAAAVAAVALVALIAVVATRAAAATTTGLPHVLYLPILVGALLGGVAGGLLTAGVAGVSMAAVPLIGGDAEGVPAAAAVRLLAYLLVGGLTGRVVEEVGRRLAASEAAARRATAEERFARGVMEAQVGPTAVLDATGTIVAVNRLWGEGTDAPGWSHLRRGGVGDEYAARCQEAGGLDGRAATEAAEGVRAVLAGEAASWELEYASGPGGEAGGPTGPGCGGDRGAPRWYRLRVSPLEPSGAVVSHTEVTAHKDTEARLAHWTLHDPLTGLPNRALFLDHLRLALLRGRESPHPLVVLVLDVDRFKGVNETMGHAGGDELLTAVGQRLASAVRPSDTVARLGSDEFAVLCEGDAGEDAVVQLARRMEDALSEPVTLSGREVFVRVSIGVEVSRGGPESPETLLRRADAAMHRAKRQGGAGYALFDEALHGRVVERIADEQALHRALPRGELSLHYQPIISLVDGRPSGVEALLRWQRVGSALLPAARFVPVAEEVGLIQGIGTWVLEEAFRQRRSWRQAHPGGPELSLSINVSARQLSAPGLVGTVQRALEATGTDAEQVVLEVTESALFDDPRSARRSLAALKELGVRLALDDYGTGFASLSHVRDFPLIDVLKIDRSFVAAVARSPGDRAIVQAVVALGHSLGMEVVGQGVETEQQRCLLDELGCDLVQGFLLGPPSAAEEVMALLGVGLPSS